MQTIDRNAAATGVTRPVLLADGREEEIGELRAALSDMLAAIARLESENAEHVAARRQLAVERDAERERVEAEHVEERERLTAEHVAERDRLAAEHAAEREVLTAEHNRLAKELAHRTGEVEALRARVREEITGRADATERAAALEGELNALAGDVLLADVSRQKRGLLRRTPKAPSARLSATRAALAGDEAHHGTIPGAGADEDLEAVVDRRLFGA